MKKFIAYALATILTVTCGWGPAMAITENQSVTVSTRDQAPEADILPPVPTDPGSTEIKLDKAVYSTDDTVINVELLNYYLDTEPDIVEIIWLDTKNVVFYSEVNESSFTIDIDLQPGEYLLRVRNASDMETYWNSYWNSYGDTYWNDPGNTWYMGRDENRDIDYPTYSASFSVTGSSNLLRLTGRAATGKYPETEVLLSAILECDGLSGGETYIVSQTDEKFEKGKVTHIEATCDGSEDYVVVNNLKLGGIYTYTMSDGKKTSNPIVINLSGIPPMEYAGNQNDSLLILQINDPYIYTAENRELAANEYAWEAISLIDRKNPGVFPIIENNRTMLPVAHLVEIMGGNVSWDGAARLVTIEIWGNTLEVPIESSTVSLNGQDYTFDTPARIEQGRTLVPIRHLELLGCETCWNEKNLSVVICYHSDDGKIQN